MTCTIETANHADGVWTVRAYVTSPTANYSATYCFEGDVDMTDAALKATILALHA